MVNERDSERAIRKLEGYEFGRYRTRPLKVQWSKVGGGGGGMNRACLVCICCAVVRYALSQLYLPFMAV
jgi:hypothetical protein